MEEFLLAKDKLVEQVHLEIFYQPLVEMAEVLLEGLVEQEAQLQHGAQEEDIMEVVQAEHFLVMEENMEVVEVEEQQQDHGLDSFYQMEEMEANTEVEEDAGNLMEIVQDGPQIRLMVDMEGIMEVEAEV